MINPKELIERRATVGFEDLLASRIRFLKAWAGGVPDTAFSGWKKHDAPLPVRTGKEQTMQVIGAGNRGQCLAVCLESRVTEEGCLMIINNGAGGYAEVALQDLPADFRAVEVFPTLLTGQRPRAEDCEVILAGYHEKAAESGAFKAAEKRLRSIAEDIGSGDQLDPMDCLNEVLGRMPETADSWHDAQVIMGVLPYLVANLYRVFHGHTVTEPPKVAPKGIAEQFVNILGTEMVKDSALAEKFIDLYIKLLSTHSTNLSWKGAQDAASGKGSIKSTVKTGIELLKTPAHGGAQRAITPMIADVKSELGLSDGHVPTLEEVVTWVKKRLTDGNPIMGFGHAVLRNHDPRGIKVNSEVLAESPSITGMWDYQILRALYEHVPTALERPDVTAIKKIASRFTNVDFTTGPAQEWVLGVTNPAVEVLAFALARIPDYMVAKIHLEALGLGIARAQSMSEINIQTVYPFTPAIIGG